MLSGWVVGAPIVNHHLVGTPRLSYRVGARPRSRGKARAIAGVRGLLFGVVLSGLLWVGVIAIVS